MITLVSLYDVAFIIREKRVNDRKNDRGMLRETEHHYNIEDNIEERPSE